MTVFIDPPMLLWAVISIWSLGSIFLYEYFIVGATVDDLEAEEIPEEIVEPEDPVEEEPVE